MITCVAQGKFAIGTASVSVFVKRGWVWGKRREAASAQPSEFPIRVSIISDVCFLRESLAQVLPHKGTASISGLFADLRDALPQIANNQPDIILLDAALPDGYAAVGQIRGIAPQVPVIVIAVAETPGQVIAWAEAGAAGYIPRTAGVSDIIPFLVAILQGKQACSKSVAVGVLRWLFNCGNSKDRRHNTISPQTLTPREAQIAQMIRAGMSNKDIARRLNIGVATTKTHVHHLLAKLDFHRRGEVANWTSGWGDRHLDL